MFSEEKRKEIEEKYVSLKEFAGAVVDQDVISCFIGEEKEAALLIDDHLMRIATRIFGGVEIPPMLPNTVPVRAMPDDVVVLPGLQPARKGKGRESHHAGFEKAASRCHARISLMTWP